MWAITVVLVLGNNRVIGGRVSKYGRTRFVSQDVSFACLKGVERFAFAFTESLNLSYLPRLISCAFVSLLEE